MHVYVQGMSVHVILKIDLLEIFGSESLRAEKLSISLTKPGSNSLKTTLVHSDLHI